MYHCMFLCLLCLVISLFLWGICNHVKTNKPDSCVVCHCGLNQSRNTFTFICFKNSILHFRPQLQIYVHLSKNCMFLCMLCLAFSLFLWGICNHVKINKRDSCVFCYVGLNLQSVLMVPMYMHSCKDKQICCCLLLHLFEPLVYSCEIKQT